MPTYRAYAFDARNHILGADWFDADDLDSAKEFARAWCKSAIPFVEIWEGAKLVARVQCANHASPEPDQ